MTSKQIETQLTSLRAQLEEAKATKAQAESRDAFDTADQQIATLTRDIEWTERQLTQAKESEAQAERNRKLARLREIRERLAPAAVNEAFAPTVADIEEAYGKLVDIIESMSKRVDALADDKQEATKLASELDEAPPTLPPATQVQALIARALMGKPTVLGWLKFPTDERGLFMLVCRLYGVEPFRFHSAVQYPDDQPLDEVYPEAEQLRDILAGTFEARTRELHDARAAKERAIAEKSKRDREEREAAEAEARKRARQGEEPEIGLRRIV